MKTLNVELGTFHLRWAITVLCVACNDCPAQIQQAWVARYNNGITNGTNQAVKMALDSAGNIYVTGFSQNSATNLGYVTIKYAPNGNQLWATRYDSTNYPSATTAAMMLDASNDVIITGSALTIKYDTNGNQLWTAPYAGTALAVDSSANIYEAGFSQNFGTVKLTPQGSNVWLTTYVEPYGPTISQSVLIDRENNIYVSGLDTYYYVPPGGVGNGPYVVLTTIKYGSNGNQIWKASNAPSLFNSSVQIGGATLAGSNGLYVVADFLPSGARYFTLRYDLSGNTIWANSPRGPDGVSISHGMAVDGDANSLVTGQNGRYYPHYCYGTFKLGISGSVLWTNNYPQNPVGTGSAASIAVDSANNSYVTGYSPGTNSSNDIVTIKYGPNGNQLWLQRYHGPGSGNDAGNAIAVDNNGNVYVTGYEATTAGGTEIVTIKYSPLTLKKQANGSFLLQAQGSPGESFDIQATADLLNWLDLGTVLADTNGLMQFADTNASNFPSRFYITNPQ